MCTLYFLVIEFNSYELRMVMILSSKIVDGLGIQVVIKLAEHGQI